jgi:phosphoglycerate dehydrogenase-like enzyme
VSPRPGSPGRRPQSGPGKRHSTAPTIAATRILVAFRRPGSVHGVRIWLPNPELERQLGPLEQATVEVVEDWGVAALPSSRDLVELVVPPQAYSGDFSKVAAQLPRLRIVQTLSAGVDQYRDALPPSVRLYNAAGVHVAATAEWVVAAILACERDLLSFAEDRRRGVWAPRPTRGLSGANVIIIGAGEIGMAVGDRLAAFGPRVRFVARRTREGVASIDRVGALLPDADIVIVLVPLTHETKRLVDREFLASMKTGALLVNASRGGVVDTGPLLRELANGRLRAALDVVAPEPPPPGSEIWSTPGLFATPHIASNVHGMLERQAALLARRLPAFARGEFVAPSEGG